MKLCYELNNLENFICAMQIFMAPRVTPKPKKGSEEWNVRLRKSTEVGSEETDVPMVGAFDRPHQKIHPGPDLVNVLTDEFLDLNRAKPGSTSHSKTVVEGGSLQSSAEANRGKCSAYASILIF